jgi:hypothetical protein
MSIHMYVCNVTTLDLEETSVAVAVQVMQTRVHPLFPLQGQRSQFMVITLVLFAFASLAAGVESGCKEPEIFAESLP